MSVLVTVCSTCLRDHEPDRAAIVAGDWKRCADCRVAATAPAPPRPAPTGACHGCGRPLRAGGRTVCGRCLGVAS